MRFHTRRAFVRTIARLDVAERAVSLPSACLLIALGWYLTLLMADEASAIAATIADVVAGTSA